MVGANSFRGQENIPWVLGLLVRVLLARVRETSAPAWHGVPAGANKPAGGNRYRRGSAGDQPGLSDNTPAVLNFLPLPVFPCRRFPLTDLWNYSDQALEKDVLHRSRLQRTMPTQQGKVFPLGKGRGGEKKGICEWAGGEQARSSNTSCGTYHDYNLLYRGSSALPVKHPLVWMARST